VTSKKTRQPSWLLAFLRILIENGITVISCVPTERRPGCWSLALLDPEHNHHGTYTQYYERYAEQADVKLCEWEHKPGKHGALVGIVLGP
jgi:hypothetical protein